MTKQSQIEQFVEDLDLDQILQLAKVMDIECDITKWSSLGFCNELDELAVKVTDGLIDRFKEVIDA